MPYRDTCQLIVGYRGLIALARRSGGLLQWAERLGAAAGVEGVHPHRFRHTFAVSFLRAGGETFALQQLLVAFGDR